jgi:hypothetical protein
MIFQQSMQVGAGTNESQKTKVPAPCRELNRTVQLIGIPCHPTFQHRNIFQQYTTSKTLRPKPIAAELSRSEPTLVNPFPLHANPLASAFIGKPAAGYLNYIHQQVLATRTVNTEQPLYYSL